MPKKIENMANDFFNSPAGEKLSGKKSEIERLANSPDGKKVKNMLGDNGDSLMSAIEKGDTTAMAKTISNILSTKEGAKLAEELSKLMK